MSGSADPRRSAGAGSRPGSSARTGRVFSWLGYLRPGDIPVVLLYAGLFVVFLFLSFKNFGVAGSALIQVSGVEYRYDLNTPRTLEFEGPVGLTVLELDGEGRARFLHSDCRDQICVAAGWLEAGGEWAACLPNRIILRMDSSAALDEALDIDATAF